MKFSIKLYCGNKEEICGIGLAPCGAVEKVKGFNGGVISGAEYVDGVNFGVLVAATTRKVKGGNVCLVAAGADDVEGFNAGGFAASATYVRGFNGGGIVGGATHVNGVNFGGLASLVLEELNGLEIGVITYANDGNYLQLGLLNFRGTGPWYKRFSPLIGYHRKKSK